MSEQPDPEAAVVEIEYPTTEELTDEENVSSITQTVIGKLNSGDWVLVCQGMLDFRRLAKFHPEEAAPLLAKVGPLLLKSLKNPRSALVKSALLVEADIFKLYGDKAFATLDVLLLELLLKAVQDKKFVCDEAQRTLAAMAANLSPGPLLQKLLPYSTHKNPKVRGKATKAAHDAVSRMDSAGIVQYGLPTLLKFGGKQVSDQLPEARESARKIVLDVHKAYLSSHVPPTTEGNGLSAAEGWEKVCRTQLVANEATLILRITASAGK